MARAEEIRLYPESFPFIQGKRGICDFGQQESGKRQGGKNLKTKLTKHSVHHASRKSVTNTNLVFAYHLVAASLAP